MERWTVHLEGGPRRVNHAAVAVGNRVYSFGGYCTGEDYVTTRPMDIHVLNAVTYRWTGLSVPSRDDFQYDATPYQRYGHTAVAYNESAYIWGGRNDVDGACNKLYEFNTLNKAWSRPEVFGNIPGARDGHSSCVVDAKMYIFGGYEEDVDKFSNEIHTLDLSVMTWSILKVWGKPARWRDFHSATAIDDNIYIFGGRSDRAGPFHTGHEMYCQQIQVFNTSTSTWSEPQTTGLAPTGRRSHSAFVHNKNLYIFGGYNGLHDVHFNDLYMYQPDETNWSVIKARGHPPCPRRRQCVCVIEDKIFIFGGTSPIPERGDVHDEEVDLMDHSDLHILDFSPCLKTLCMLMVIEHNLEKNWLPRDIRWELQAMTTNSTISRPLSG